MNAHNAWDAQAYEHVSKVQQGWGIRLLRSRKWGGSETVMDAGCGPGTLTKVLAGVVARGKVYAVDKDAGMAERAKTNLRGIGNVEVICADMSRTGLPGAVDVVFSNAAIHWVMDHSTLFAHFKELLAEGGELLLQFGGEGNLEHELQIADRVIENEHFAPHFSDWKAPWNFSTRQETSDLLGRLGFRDIVSEISFESPVFSTKREFEDFLRTVILRPYLQDLQPDDKDRFVQEFLALYAKDRAKMTLDYVRLTVTAKK